MRDALPKVKLMLVSLLLLELGWALTCTSPSPSLLELCKRVGVRVERLWGKVNATVLVERGSEDYTTQRGDIYLIHLRDVNECTMAHELTHVIQLYRKVRAPLWYLEGQAQLSCYLLFPNEFKETGFVEWLKRGYGELDPYDFGLVVLYFLYFTKGNIEYALSIPKSKALEIFATALHYCITPYNMCPGSFHGVVRGTGLWWVKADVVEGADIRVGKVAIVNGEGLAYSVPSPSILALVGALLRRVRRS